MYKSGNRSGSTLKNAGTDQGAKNGKIDIKGKYGRYFYANPKKVWKRSR